LHYAVQQQQKQCFLLRIMYNFLHKFGQRHIFSGQLPMLPISQSLSTLPSPMNFASVREYHIVTDKPIDPEVAKLSTFEGTQHMQVHAEICATPGCKDKDKRCEEPCGPVIERALIAIETHSVVIKGEQTVLLYL
jgi:hypothetical protein